MFRFWTFEILEPRQIGAQISGQILGSHENDENDEKMQRKAARMFVWGGYVEEVLGKITTSPRYERAKERAIMYLHWESYTLFALLMFAVLEGRG